MCQEIWNIFDTRFEARGGAVGWGTALQASRSRVRIPLVSLEMNMCQEIWNIFDTRFEARGGAVGWGTALQASRLRVRIQLVSLEMTMCQEIWNIFDTRFEARGGAVDWGTALQASRSRFRIPMVSLEIFHWYYPSGLAMASQLPTQKSTRNIFWRIKTVGVSNVYWTVHHYNGWRMKDQLDVTCYFISLIMCSTCFGH